MTNEIYQLVLFGNPVSGYLTALLILAVGLIIFSILEHRVLRRLEEAALRSKTRIDDAVVKMLKSIHPSFYWFLSLYLGLKSLVLPSLIDVALNAIFFGWVLYQAVRAGSVALDLLVTASATTDGERRARGVLAGIGKGVLWIVALLLLLSNLGINVSSLLAGLGIGGIAIAFALQNILADLFSSFAIFLDKPFEIGDFIVVGDKMGTVSRIGIKTTRLIALQGEEIVLSNKELTTARIQNFKRMRERRVVMNFGIAHATAREAVAMLPEKIRSAIEHIPDIRVERVHVSGFDSSAILFELVYLVTNSNYETYMDRRQAINLALLDLFRAENVTVA